MSNKIISKNSEFDRIKGYPVSDKLETVEINILNDLLTENNVKTFLTQKDKIPNFDGYIELTRRTGKKAKARDITISTFWVQVKPLSDSELKNKKCRIPMSLIIASKETKLEPVLFMAVNRKKKVFCWINIDTLISQINKNATITVSFPQSQIVKGKNQNFIADLKKIYEEKKALTLKSEISSLDDFFLETKNLHSRVSKFSQGATSKTTTQINETSKLSLYIKNQNKFFEKLNTSLNEGESVTFDQRLVSNISLELLNQEKAKYFSDFKELDKVTFSLGTLVQDILIFNPSNNQYLKAKFQGITLERFIIFNEFIKVKIFENEIKISYESENLDIFGYEEAIKLLEFLTLREWVIFWKGNKLIEMSPDAKLIQHYEEVISNKKKFVRDLKEVLNLFTSLLNVKNPTNADYFWLGFFKNFQTNYTNNPYLNINFSAELKTSIYEIKKEPLSIPYTLTFDDFSDEQTFNLFLDKKTYPLNVQVEADTSTIIYFESIDDYSIVTINLNGQQDKLRLKLLNIIHHK